MFFSAGSAVAYLRSKRQFGFGGGNAFSQASSFAGAGGGYGGYGGGASQAFSSASAGAVGGGGFPYG